MVGVTVHHPHVQLVRHHLLSGPPQIEPTLQEGPQVLMVTLLRDAEEVTVIASERFMVIVPTLMAKFGHTAQE